MVSAWCQIRRCHPKKSSHINTFSGFLHILPWQTKSIRVIFKHLQKGRILPRFAAICEPDFSGCSLQQCHDLAEIRQNAANHGRQW